MTLTFKEPKPQMQGTRMRGTRQIAVLVTRDGETPMGKVGSVCPPCFSILLQRRELFIPRGRGIWRSRPKCKISVAPESLPPGLQPPSHPFRGAGLGPEAREGGRVLRAPTRGRQSVSAGAGPSTASCVRTAPGSQVSRQGCHPLVATP